LRPPKPKLIDRQKKLLEQAIADVSVYGEHQIKGVEVFVSQPEFKKYLSVPAVQQQLDFGVS